MAEKVALAQPVVIAVDQGTSATKALLVRADGSVLERASVPLTQRHPRPGWVEQDPMSIFESVHSVISALRSRSETSIAALGFSTQRESVMVWKRADGTPMSPLLSWQDRRTTQRAQELQSERERIRSITGLPLDPMFSALKIAWILDEIDPDRRRSRAGELAVGTVDSWLSQQLTGRHRIELGNASRTQLLDIESASWSDGLLGVFDIPRACLPELGVSDERFETEVGIPLHGVLGDSHAAL